MTYKKEDSTVSIEEIGNNPLPEQFLDTMDRIKEHREQAELFTADLDLLRKRFDVEKSLFGKVAANFSALPWWQKGLIGFGLSFIAVLIGLAATVAWAIALPIITITLYSAIAYVFYDHNQSEENRFTHLSEGLVQREEKMKKSILELQTAENELYQLIEKLREFEQGSAEAVDNFNAQVQLLEEKVKRYENTVLQFEQLNAVFSTHTEGMQTIATEFSDGLNQIGEQLSQQFERIKQNTGDVEQATQRLNENIADLRAESLSITIDEGPTMDSRFEKLTEGFVFRTDEERQQEQQRFAKADSFLDQTDDFLLEMGAFLSQHQEANQLRLVTNQDPVFPPNVSFGLR